MLSFLGCVPTPLCNQFRAISTTLSFVVSISSDTMPMTKYLWYMILAIYIDFCLLYTLLCDNIYSLIYNYLGVIDCVDYISIAVRGCTKTISRTRRGV